MNDADEAYPEEIELGQLFNSIGACFVRLGRGIEPAREQNELKDISKRLLDAKL